MRLEVFPVVLGAMALGFSSLAHAQDGDRIELTDTSIQKHVIDAGVGGWSEKKAIDLVRSAFSDGAISPSEKLLFDQLKKGTGVSVISAGDGVVRELPPMPPEGVRVIDIAYSQLDLDALWLADDESMRRFVIYSMLTPGTKATTTRFMASKWFEAYGTGGYVDNPAFPDKAVAKYKPVYDMVAQFHGYSSTWRSDPYLHDAAYDIIFESVLMLDQHFGGEIPDALYTQFRPGSPFRVEPNR